MREICKLENWNEGLLSQNIPNKPCYSVVIIWKQIFLIVWFFLLLFFSFKTECEINNTDIRIISKIKTNQILCLRFCPFKTFVYTSFSSNQNCALLLKKAGVLQNLLFVISLLSQNSRCLHYKARLFVIHHIITIVILLNWSLKILRLNSWRFSFPNEFSMIIL